jgi:hypothetical protein
MTQRNKKKMEKGGKKRTVEKEREQEKLEDVK